MSGGSAEAAQELANWLKGEKTSADLYKNVKPMPMPEAMQQLCAFVQREADAFSPSYEYENPWLAKKENKGKKPKPPKK